MHCELVSWEKFQQLARQLAVTIRNAALKPDIIVAIGRGGYLPARILSDYLGVFDLTTIKVEHYHGAHKERVAKIRYPLTARITGKKVLLVDDVSDSGDTFQVATRHLRENGEALLLKTAVLHHKTVSSFVPDYFAEEVTQWRWIIYPWAVIEDLTSFMQDMRTPPENVNEFDAYLQHEHGLKVSPDVLHDVLISTKP